ncbi:MAG: phage morphogenesis protein [Comamonadaceae bacterium CG_4_9_14_0_8_um_filter_57_21]|nr:MAG: phage morphogenesis protein [Comamonadaceae bacterium CG_4_9_14_0_8_um_filter_57_21]
MITVQVNDKQVLDVLAALTRRSQDLRPALKEIGEDVAESTKRRFASASAPEGTPWAANSQVTIDRYLGLFASSYKKDGTLSKAGTARGGSKKPLTGETKALQRTIHYQVNGSSSVSIGSPMVYGAMQQFGGTVAQFPHLWGDIPARPFLGLSAPDSANIVAIVGSYLAGPAQS